MLSLQMKRTAWPEMICWVLGLVVALVVTVFAARDTYLIPLTPRSALSAEDAHVSLLFDPTDSPKFTGGLVTMRDVTQYGVRGTIVYGLGKPPTPPEIRDGFTGRPIPSTQRRLDPDTPVWFILNTAGDWNNPNVYADRSIWIESLQQAGIAPDVRRPSFWRADLHSVGAIPWLGAIATAMITILAIVRLWRAATKH
jgi:hypothetical protein